MVVSSPFSSKVSPTSCCRCSRRRMHCCSPSDTAVLPGIIKRMHGELAALSAVGASRVVPGSSHYVQLGKPQAVIDTVSDVLAKVAER